MTPPVRWEMGSSYSPYPVIDPRTAHPEDYVITTPNVTKPQADTDVFGGVYRLVMVVLLIVSALAAIVWAL